jgi:peroxiredoxin
LASTYGDTEDFVRLWLFVGTDGPARLWSAELGLVEPVLVDDDESTSRAYFIENSQDGFATNPRHFVIDRSGDLALVERTVSPETLIAAIDAAL